MATATAPIDTPMKPGLEIRLAMGAVKCYRGAAAAVALGTGYATPLVVTTVGHQFIGVFEETFDNSAGSAGGAYIRVARSGIFAFNQGAILAASVGQRAYFSDDNTVTTTVGQNFAGIIVAIDQQNGVAWVDIETAVLGLNGNSNSGVIVISASGAIAPSVQANYVITKAGVAAMTLAAPVTGTDDGKIIQITSTTANQHTITATGLFLDGAGHVNVATFGTSAGGTLILMAYAAKWYVISVQQVTMS